MALELSTFDLLPKTMPSFARGFTAALVATVSCYPLDTVRRHIQLQAGQALAWRVVFSQIVAEDGVQGLFRGFLPNALKNLPNKGERVCVWLGVCVCVLNVHAISIRSMVTVLNTVDVVTNANV